MTQLIEAEPVTATTPGVVVLEAKLHPPTLHPEHVARPRLLQRLDEATARRMTLVSAPAGFGKTTLLASWMAQASPAWRCAWLSLDEGENDPAVFWSYVLQALSRLAPGRFDGEIRAVQTSGVSFTHAVLPVLLNTLWSLDEPIVLILDDYHLVSNAACHESLQFLLRRLPPSVHLVIATRADPPLELATLRARGQLAEVRAADLRFTDAEASTLLTDWLALPLSASDVQRLAERTEGWPAGLYLGALSMRDQEDVSAFIAAFAGSHRHIVDYLGTEVLARLGDEDRDFLLRTSVLESFTASLCTALTGSTDATVRLAELERTNLFLMPLDPQRHWYRYHHLFRELLQVELARLEPDLIPALHGRAAAWYREEGDFAAAMRHALTAGDTNLAGTLLAEHWGRFAMTGQLVTLDGWLKQLPPETFIGRPSSALAAAYVAAQLRRPIADVERYIAVVGDEEADGPLPHGTPSVRAAVTLLRASQPYDNVGLMVAAAETAVADNTDPDRPAYVLARVSMGMAHYRAGLSVEARAALEDALHARPAPSVATQAFIRAVLSVVCLELGEPDRAAALAGQAAADLAAAGITETSTSWWVPVALSRVLMHQGHMVHAERVLSEGLEHRLPELRERPLAHAQALLFMAQMRAGRGHAQAARSLADEARTVIAGCTDPGMLPALLSTTECAMTRQPRRVTGLRQELSEGELRVLRLLVSDLTQREISQELYLSLNTVRTHLRSIYTKLDASSRDQAVTRARTLGLIA